MRVKRSSNSNMKFLYGSVFFFAVIILTILLFVYYTMREAAKNAPFDKVIYTVSFSENLAGDNGMVFLDDSMLYVATPFTTDTVVEAQRYVTYAKDATGKKYSVPHFTENSILKVEIEGVDTLVATVGEKTVFHIEKDSLGSLYVE